jgi:hypothetical protein
VKAASQEGPVRRFSLSTAFLIVVPLAVYLAAFRWIVRRMPTDDLRLLAWIALSGIYVMFVLFTTVVLLCWAEAIVWVAVVLLRRLRARDRARRDDASRDERG